MFFVFFDCFGYVFYEFEVGIIIDKCFVVFFYLFVNLMGGIEVYWVDVVGCGIENFYFFYKGY